MNQPTTSPRHPMKNVMLVNRYATPLALLLVCLGLVLSQPVGHARLITVVFLIFSILFNVAIVPLIARDGSTGEALARARMLVNVAVNVGLVYVLGAYWSPMWLLLVLTPVATAIYQTRSKTLVTSVGMALALFIIRFFQGGSGALEWGEEAAHGAFIILLSLMINELARSVDNNKQP